MSPDLAVAEGEPTAGEYLTRWLAHVRGRVRAKTFDGYEGLIRLYALPGIGVGLRWADLDQGRTVAYVRRSLQTAGATSDSKSPRPPDRGGPWPCPGSSYPTWTASGGPRQPGARPVRPGSRWTWWWTGATGPR